MAHVELSDDFIAELIACEKHIVGTSTKSLAVRQGNKRRSLTLRASSDDHRFEVFMRQLIALPEEYSVGLVYRTRYAHDPIVLLRFNGDHGYHKNPDRSVISGQHIHRATAAILKVGGKPEAFAEGTTKFGSFEEAQIHMFKTANVVGWEALYPELLRIPLFDLAEDTGTPSAEEEAET